MVSNETAYHEWLEGPASYTPSGGISNLSDSPSLRKYDVICQSVCLTVVTILLCLRIYTKGRILKSLGWDDYTSIAAWLGLIAYGAILLHGDRYGGGQHIWNISGKDYVTYAKLMNASEMAYTVTILLTKTSILLLYLRIFSSSRTLRILIYACLWANVIFYTVGFFIELFMCSPREAIWNPWIENWKCINQFAAEFASAIFNAISDFAILVLPMSTVWTLQAKKEKKLALAAVFATGLFGCVASLVRMGLTAGWLNGVSDQVWDLYPMELWSYAEISAGIICGCMTAVPAFLRHFHDRAVKRSLSIEDGLALKETKAREGRRADSS